MRTETEEVGMGLGRRFLRLLGGSEQVPADPLAVVGAAVVHLSQGPMLVAGLQDRGIHAVGVESFSVVTDTRSLMRIMVRRADLAAATEALEALQSGGTDDTGPDGDGDDVAAAAGDGDGDVQAAMADLFLAADRLWHAPWDALLLAEVERLAALLGTTGPPYGVEPSAWEQVGALCAAVADAEPGDQDDIGAGALALRSILRDYV